ncbi:signal recognition particle receptor subunit beta-like [Artemia franciscana]|uniref:Signal recognition particle receptor subunit beta n=1 Tax=Artemia franciscana TaxID=6661 RepID=A0AA88LC72_ARTSF|nr:hypothetical protein QYM36_004608 [Artemia franciscana]
MSLRNEYELDWLSIIIAVTVILASIGLIWFLKRKPKGKSILLVGLPGSGKTQIFGQLIHKKPVLTVTSVKENVGSLALDEKKRLTVVDIPGHIRFRQEFFDAHKRVAKAIVFVVDSTTYTRNLKDITEYIYDILTDDQIATASPRILVFCNKCDKGSRVKDAVKNAIEKEMEFLYVSKQNRMNSSGSANNNTFLGKIGNKFSFSDLAKIEVDFAEGFATNENITVYDQSEVRCDLDVLHQWIVKA